MKSNSTGRCYEIDFECVSQYLRHMRPIDVCNKQKLFLRAIINLVTSMVQPSTLGFCEESYHLPLNTRPSLYA